MAETADGVDGDEVGRPPSGPGNDGGKPPVAAVTTMQQPTAKLRADERDWTGGEPPERPRRKRRRTPRGERDNELASKASATGHAPQHVVQPPEGPAASPPLPGLPAIALTADGAVGWGVGRPPVYSSVYPPVLAVRSTPEAAGSGYGRYPPSALQLLTSIMPQIPVYYAYATGGMSSGPMVAASQWPASVAPVAKLGPSHTLGGGRRGTRIADGGTTIVATSAPNSASDASPPERTRVCDGEGGVLQAAE